LPTEIRHILAPTDFSEPANQAVTAVCELAQTFGAKLTVLHGVEPRSSLVDRHASAHQGPLRRKAIEEQATQTCSETSSVFIIRPTA
jgi:nucleotide-binding universal stress UspA family protein